MERFIKVFMYVLSLVAICIIIKSPTERGDLLSWWSMGELLFGIGAVSTFYNLIDKECHMLISFVAGMIAGATVILVKYLQII